MADVAAADALRGRGAQLETSALRHELAALRAQLEEFTRQLSQRQLLSNTSIGMPQLAR